MSCLQAFVFVVVAEIVLATDIASVEQVITVTQQRAMPNRGAMEAMIEVSTVPILWHASWW